MMVFPSEWLEPQRGDLLGGGQQHLEVTVWRKPLSQQAQQEVPERAALWLADVAAAGDSDWLDAKGITLHVAVCTGSMYEREFKEQRTRLKGHTLQFEFICFDPEAHYFSAGVLSFVRRVAGHLLSGGRVLLWNESNALGIRIALTIFMVFLGYRFIPALQELAKEVTGIQDVALWPWAEWFDRQLTGIRTSTDPLTVFVPVILKGPAGHPAALAMAGRPAGQQAAGSAQPPTTQAPVTAFYHPASLHPMVPLAVPVFEPAAGAAGSAVAFNAAAAAAASQLAAGAASSAVVSPEAAAAPAFQPAAGAAGSAAAFPAAATAVAEDDGSSATSDSPAEDDATAEADICSLMTASVVDQVRLTMELRRIAETARATPSVYEVAAAEVAAYMASHGVTQEELDEHDAAIEEVQEQAVKTRRQQMFGPPCGGRDMQPGPYREKNANKKLKKEKRALEKELNPEAEQRKTANQYRDRIKSNVDKVVRSRATGTGASSSSHQ